MKKIGVFVCHCGINIASTVDINKTVEALKDYPGVAHVEDYKYMCSEPGQELLKQRVKELGLDGVVVSACSPTLHESTFRIAAREIGMNPYNVEMANIREQCSWVHPDKEIGTPKAIKIIKSLVGKTLLDEPLEPLSVPITRKALVIGGGIAGIQAALNIANSGHEVILVEREPSIGGHMAQLSETFPTLDCSQCILTPKMVEVNRHKNIQLMTYSEIEEISGFVGNFKVKIKKKAAYVDWDKCNGCGDCLTECPIETASEFDMGLGKRTAIYRPFPQAVPNRVVIDPERCVECLICDIVCTLDAIDHSQKDEIIDVEVGAIVMATGFDTYPLINLPEYGSGIIPDVIDGLTFERLLSASGPTGGEVRRLSDGKIPKEVVFIKCVGSRDPEHHFAYCSKICCMYTAKHAMLYKHRVHDGQAYIFYMDVRTGGKNYEEFYHRTAEEENVFYIRGKVPKIYWEDGKVVVCGTDTLSNENVEIRADMVVLATAVRPSVGSDELFKKLKLGTSINGFLTEAHPKLRPVESVTAGVFLAGCAQAPRDIPDTVAQASGAASMVSGLFNTDELYHEPITVRTNENTCSGCGLCIDVCPYDARTLNLAKGVAEVNEILCEGCGACVAACLSGAVDQKNFTDKQLLGMVEVLLA
jgi:heterodisulfide reductase subunit A